MKTVRNKRRGLKTLAACLLLIFVIAARAYPADYSVSPMGLALSKHERTGAITVTNDSTDTITIQIAVSEWNQNADGKDVYSRTRDIVFYPKMLVIEPRSEQVVRVGCQGPVPAREKAYRLFIQEAPGSNKKRPDARASVSIGIRFVLPLFIMPAVEASSGIIESVALSPRMVKAAIKNTGTVHLKISSIKVNGKSADGRYLFSKEIQGWYILQGASKTYEIPIAPGDCSKLSTLDVEAQSGTVTLNGSLKVGEEMCR